MAYATLIVHAEAGDDGKAGVTLAAKLARQVGAMLVGVAARDLVPPITALAAGAVIATLLAVQEKDIQADLDAAEQQFWGVTDRQDQRFAWRSLIGNPAKMLAREARAADLIVVTEGQRASAPADPGTRTQATS